MYMYSIFTVYHTIIKVVFLRPQVVLKISFFKRLFSTSSQLELDEDPDGSQVPDVRTLISLDIWWHFSLMFTLRQERID